MTPSAPGGVVRPDGERSQPPFLIAQGPAQHGLDIGIRQWLELENLRAGDQRTVHIEEGIVRGGPDEAHRAALDPRQQDVLLRFVEAVDLVHEKRRRPSVHAPQ